MTGWRLGLGHLAGLKATRADAHTLGVALAVGRADRLQIRQEAALGDAGRVETDAALVLRRTLADDNVADRRTLTANITNSGHFLVPFVRSCSVGFAGLPFNVSEGIVKRGGQTTEVLAASALRGNRLDLLARGLGLKRLDLVVGHRHRTDGETDAALIAVNLDHTSLDVLTDIKRVLDLLDTLIGDLGDVASPSTPSSSSMNAPNEAILETLPLTVEPTGNFFAISFHGSC